MPSTIKKIPKALFWLSATVFILTAAPRLNIKIGPLPLYGIDFFIFMTFVYSVKMKSVYRGKRPLSGIIVLILIFAFLGELAAVVYSGDAWAQYTLFHVALHHRGFRGPYEVICPGSSARRRAWQGQSLSPPFT